MNLSMFRFFLFLAILFSHNSFAVQTCREKLLSALDIQNYYQDQFQKELLAEFPGTPGLCGATCMTNSVRLMDALEGVYQAKLKRQGILETVGWVESFKAVSRKADPYDPLTDGVSFEANLRAIVKKAPSVFPGVKFISKTEDPFSANDRRRIQEWIRTSDQVEHRFESIALQDLTNLDYDFFILSFVSYNTAGDLTDFAHGVIGVYDPKSHRLKVLDPSHPNEASWWKFEKTKDSDYQVNLKRVSGPYVADVQKVAVHEMIAVQLPNQ